MSERISVLHLNSPTSIAGAERVILNYLDFRDTGNFRMHVASFINRNSVESNAFPAFVEGKKAGSHVIPVSRSIDPGDIGKVVGIIRETGADIVHTHGYRADTIGLVASRMTGKKAVATVHGWTPVSAKLRMYERLDKLALRCFDYVVAVSSAIGGELARWRVPSGRVSVINNAGDIPTRTQEESAAIRARIRAELGIAEDEFVVTAVGRLSPEKGFCYFVEAMKAVLAEAPRTRGLLVGEGVEAQALKRAAALGGIEDRLLFTGFRSDAPEIVAAGDILAVPSLTEGIPMVVLEAFAARCPVVATQVGGLPEMITDCYDGVLVPPADPAELARKISLLRRDAGLRQGLAEHAYRTVVNRYDPVAWAGRIEEIYRRLAGEAGR